MRAGACASTGCSQECDRSRHMSCMFNEWGLSIYALARTVALSYDGRHVLARWLNLWGADPERALPDHDGLSRDERAARRRAHERCKWLAALRTQGARKAHSCLEEAGDADHPHPRRSVLGHACAALGCLRAATPDVVDGRAITRFGGPERDAASRTLPRSLAHALDIEPDGTFKRGLTLATLAHDYGITTSRAAKGTQVKDRIAGSLAEVNDDTDATPAQMATLIERMTQVNDLARYGAAAAPTVREAKKRGGKMDATTHDAPAQRTTAERVRQIATATAPGVLGRPRTRVVWWRNSAGATPESVAALARTLEASARGVAPELTPIAIAALDDALERWLDTCEYSDAYRAEPELITPATVIEHTAAQLALALGTNAGLHIVHGMDWIDGAYGTGTAQSLIEDVVEHRCEHTVRVAVLLAPWGVEIRQNAEPRTVWES